MANLQAWEDGEVTANSHPGIRFEWRPNVKEQEPDYDGAPEYLDDGQLVTRFWEDSNQQWGNPVHVGYMHVDGVPDKMEELYPGIQFRLADS